MDDLWGIWAQWGSRPWERISAWQAVISQLGYVDSFNGNAQYSDLAVYPAPPPSLLAPI